jgi:hypothetical protein
MPFSPARKAYPKHINLASVASENDDELVNIYFQKTPNAQTNQYYGVKKCLGYSKFNTNASLPGAKAGLGLFGFQPSVGNYTFLYGAWDNAAPTDTQIYTVKSGVDPITCGANGLFATHANTVEFEQANDTLYATNGVDAVCKMISDGTWSRLSSGEPMSGANTVAKYLSWHNFMMFAARTQTNPNKLNVSGAGTPETFSTYTKTFPFAIVGMKPLANYQVLYTEKSIHLISGYEPSLLAFQEVINPHPCVSHRSIVQYKGDRGYPEHIYLGSDYVWAFNGSGFRKLGEGSWDLIKEGLSTARLNQACAYYDRDYDQYRISVCTGANTTNDTTYAYDFTAGVWIQLPYWSACVYAQLGSPTPTTYWQEASALGWVLKANDGNNIVIPGNKLNGNHTAIVGTITVDSTTGFPSTGYIVCGTETIRYTGTTATEFTGCVRGSCGTTAIAHSDDAPVYVAPKFKYTTIFLDGGEKNLFKKYQVGWADLNSTTSAYSVDVQYNIDRFGYAVAKSIPIMTSGAVWNSDSSYTWGDFTWGASSKVIYPDQRFTISGRGQEISLSFEENCNIAETEINQFEFRYKLLKKK